VEVASLDDFFRFAERVFQFRRKQLGGSLARLGAPEAAARAGIDPSRRPQTLSLAEWEALYEAAEARLK
jgi:16S rRNA A1518/A1519 N6-dimethyltransferase RsmA/KsgA/DIM1 with predicted DNA glycosylase/AP lyase activity